MLNFASHRPRSLLISLILLSLAACQGVGEDTSARHSGVLPKPYIALNQLKHTQLEIASTSAEQELGLMNRSYLPENAGMLFVFDKARRYCFWMKNTLIPLTVGFLDEKGILIQTENMAAQTQNTHCAKTAIKYAIEMNHGWYDTHKVEIGTPLLKIQTKL